jgi:hypothetical protein
LFQDLQAIALTGCRSAFKRLIAYGERSALPLSERSGERNFTNLVQNYTIKMMCLQGVANQRLAE